MKFPLLFPLIAFAVFEIVFANGKHNHFSIVALTLLQLFFYIIFAFIIANNYCNNLGDCVGHKCVGFKSIAICDEYTCQCVPLP